MLLALSLATWVTISERDVCAIGASFGSEPQITLSLTASNEKADIVYVSLERKGWSIVDRGSYPATLSFDDETIDVVASGVKSPDQDSVPRLIVPVTASTIKTFAVASTFAVNVKGTSVANLSLAGSAKAVRSLQACTGRLPAWTTAKQARDAAAKARASDPFSTIQPATPVSDRDPSDWLTFDDYPASALNNREEGRVEFRFSINAQGRVGNCVITRSSGSAALDRATCSVLTRRAHYSPGEREMTGAFEWKMP